jgi:hypothetical protein
MVVPDHIGRLQIFIRDTIVGAHQLRRFPVMEVAPLVGDALMRFRQEHNRIGTAMAPLLAPRDPPRAAP